MTCHRAISICKHLRDQQIAIRHIIDHERTETQADMEKRLIAALKLHSDLFNDADSGSLIERAYDLQADRVAYVEKADLKTQPL